MSEEAQSAPANVVMEVTVKSGAVIALTKQNAVFRNGRQLVIPHVGTQFIQELMEALTSFEFVTAIVDNDAALNEKRNVAEALGIAPYCGHFGADVMLNCNDIEGHEGPHSYTEVNGGVTVWHDHEVEPETVPSRDIPVETNLDGFEVAWELGTQAFARVRHINSTQEVHFESLDEAYPVADGAPHYTEYERLCAKAYIDWYRHVIEESNPETATVPAHWRMWKAGDVLHSDVDTYALVVTSGEGLAVVNHEGNVFGLSHENDDIFSHWQVDITKAEQ